MVERRVAAGAIGRTGHDRTVDSAALVHGAPALIADGFAADAAFVDGSHRFHEVFVDLYFLRKIVRPGGIIILDDHWWPSVRAAQRYYETNMGWQVLQDALDGVSIDEATGRPRIQALRLPDPSVLRREFVS